MFFGRQVEKGSLLNENILKKIKIQNQQHTVGGAMCGVEQCSEFTWTRDVLNSQSTYDLL